MLRAKTQNMIESARVLLLPVRDIRPNPAQPRRVFDPDGLQELADSISAYGILQPLSVRRTPSGWELIAGERRLRGDNAPIENRCHAWRWQNTLPWK